jgi:hypothetical protein
MSQATNRQLSLFLGGECGGEVGAELEDAGPGGTVAGAGREAWYKAAACGVNSPAFLNSLGNSPMLNSANCPRAGALQCPSLVRALRPVRSAATFGVGHFIVSAWRASGGVDTPPASFRSFQASPSLVVLPLLGVAQRHSAASLSCLRRWPSSALPLQSSVPGVGQDADTPHNSGP